MKKIQKKKKLKNYDSRKIKNNLTPKQRDFHSENASDQINKSGILGEHLRIILSFVISIVCILGGFFFLFRGDNGSISELSFGSFSIKTSFVGLILVGLGIIIALRIKSKVNIINRN